MKPNKNCVKCIHFHEKLDHTDPSGTVDVITSCTSPIKCVKQNQYQEETVMETKEVNIEEAAAEMQADTTATQAAVQDHKKSNIKFGPWMPPTTKQLDAIISFGASFTYDEKIKWPALGTFDIEAAKHILDQLHQLYKEGKMTRRYYPDLYKGYYAEKLKIARSIAAKWPETRMDSKLTTENSNSKH